MDVGDVIFVVVYFGVLGVLVWIGYCIGRIISLRRKSKRLAQGGVVHQRGTGGQCFICMGYCPTPVSREMYLGSKKKSPSRRNRTW